MIRLPICSLVLVCLMLSAFVVAQDMFGDATAKDKDGADIEPVINEWGGSEFVVGDGKSLNIKYGGSDSSYDGLPGKYTLSEYGKIVEADFEVESDKKDVVIGNLRVDLEKGAHVSFKDGELKIENPGKMIDKDDVDFVEADSGWDDNHLKLSGDGVDYMGLDEVELDSAGFYLRDPEGVEFKDLKVYGEGKVYFLEGGEPNLDLPGAYISVNSEAGKFAIGSNIFGDSVSVMPNAENKYGLKYDVESDYVAFKSIGGAESSYLTVQDRTAEGLTPRVDGVGFFAVDDNSKSVYMGEEEKIYMIMDGNAISGFGSPGTTMSPVEIGFSKMEGGNVVPLSDYGGVVIFGNDGGVGYGSNPSYVLAGQYGDKKGRALNLYHGASNFLSYNYYAGGSELFGQLFGLSFDGSRVNILDDPAHGKYLLDLLFQTPSKYRQQLESMTLKSSYGGAIAWGSPDWIGIGVDQGAFEHDTISHELGHVFDMNFGNEIDSMIGRGNVPVVKGAYSGSGTERYSTFLERRFEPLDSYWQANYNGNTQVQRAVAAFTIAEGMTFLQGKNILEAIGTGEINDMDDVRRVVG